MEEIDGLCMLICSVFTVWDRQKREKYFFSNGNFPSPVWGLLKKKMKSFPNPCSTSMCVAFLSFPPAIICLLFKKILYLNWCLNFCWAQCEKGKHTVTDKDPKYCFLSYFLFLKHCPSYLSFNVHLNFLDIGREVFFKELIFIISPLLSGT